MYSSPNLNCSDCSSSSVHEILIDDILEKKLKKHHTKPKPSIVKLKQTKKNQNKNHSFYMHYFKGLCMVMSCKSMNNVKDLTESPLRAKSKYHLHASLSSLSSFSSISLKDPKYFIDSLTYDHLKPIELIAEDFDDELKRFTTSEDGSVDSKTLRLNRLNRVLVVKV